MIQHKGRAAAFFFACLLSGSVAQSDYAKPTIAEPLAGKVLVWAGDPAYPVGLSIKRKDGRLWWSVSNVFHGSNRARIHNSAGRTWDLPVETILRPVVSGKRLYWPAERAETAYSERNGNVASAAAYPGGVLSYSISAVRWKGRPLAAFINDSRWCYYRNGRFCDPSSLLDMETGEVVRTLGRTPGFVVDMHTWERRLCWVQNFAERLVGCTDGRRWRGLDAATIRGMKLRGKRRLFVGTGAEYGQTGRSSTTAKVLVLRKDGSGWRQICDTGAMMITQLTRQGGKRYAVTSAPDRVLRIRPGRCEVIAEDGFDLSGDRRFGGGVAKVGDHLYWLTTRADRPLIWRIEL